MSPPENHQPEPETADLTPAEAAAMLGIHENTLNRAADLGKIAVWKTPGGHRRYWRSVIERIKRSGEYAIVAEVERNHPHQEDK